MNTVNGYAGFVVSVLIWILDKIGGKRALGSMNYKKWILNEIYELPDPGIISVISLSI